MCELEPVGHSNVTSWQEMAAWLAQTFEGIETGDIFSLGPRLVVRFFPMDDDEFEPCAQVLRLEDAVFLRLSTLPLGAPLLSSYGTRNVRPDVWHRPGRFEDRCTFGWIVSRDWELMAETCVNWFRDRHRMKLHQLGCRIHTATSLAGPRGIPPSERY